MSPNNSKYDYSDKVVLVTGSSSGIGAAMSIQFAQYGARVTITGRNAENLDKVAQEIEKVSNGVKPLQIIGDLQNDDSLPERLIKETVEKFGRLDVLVNNAGAATPKGTFASPELLEEFDSVFKLNVRVPVALTQLAVPHLEKTKGNVINISSGTSLRPYWVVYSSSKAAINMVTQTSALELGPKGIRVNTIAPGPVRTSFLRSIGIPGEMHDKFFDSAEELSLMKRLGTPEDIANLASFVASDDAKNITGALLISDSGTFIKSPDNRSIVKKD